MYDYTQSLTRSRISRENGREVRQIDLRGEQWTVLPDVFSPSDSRSSLAHLDLLEFPVGGSFLEVGSGTGLIAVSAARAGCAVVYASDINPAAVRNSELNAQRFGVADRVTAVHSDLFDALTDAPRFDVVYWHSNNVWVPPTLELEHLHDLAYVDPGYEAHRRFFREAHDHVTADGQVLLALSSRAGRPELEELAAAEDRVLKSVTSALIEEPEGLVSYELVEVVHA
nr:50S ribosomal protein L11 methyltransferase [Kibdelosporangium sp. MJ126-NF4]CEL19935.1 Protein-N(5)-glutamine methyltransferase PrmC, methylates polypeptide chain release factors RF1 and RF2 [Kibdelosporangium sp. MJ126-NF4]CTQ97159.1 Protein-N(5)-glutamine methyltransferase PrmC, methylates polypeptide chain release factors RF1 and RF2 [Kibdelosporangium sp. MJ126-NF4]